MTFETFESKVRAYCKYTGVRAVRVFHEDGKHIARLSNGDEITGNSDSSSVTIRDEYWNHCRMYTPVPA